MALLECDLAGLGVFSPAWVFQALFWVGTPVKEDLGQGTSFSWRIQPAKGLSPLWPAQPSRSRSPRCRTPGASAWYQLLHGCWGPRDLLPLPASKHWPQRSAGRELTATPAPCQSLGLTACLSAYRLWSPTPGHFIYQL